MQNEALKDTHKHKHKHIQINGHMKCSVIPWSAGRLNSVQWSWCVWHFIGSCCDIAFPEFLTMESRKGKSEEKWKSNKVKKSNWIRSVPSSQTVICFYWYHLHSYDCLDFQSGRFAFRFIVAAVVVVDSNYNCKCRSFANGLVLLAS